MQIRPSLIFSLMALVTTGLAMALGSGTHSEPAASRLASLIFMLCIAIALVLTILDIRRERSSSGDWVRVTIRLMWPIALIIVIALLRW